MVTVLLYAPALDPRLQKITELADRVFYIYCKQAKSRAKGRGKDTRSQGRLEAYSCGLRFRLVSSYQLKIRKHKNKSTGKLY